MFKRLSRLPYVLWLVIAWALCRTVFHVEMTGLVASTFIGLAMAVLVIEFFKSTDIGLRSFQVKMVFVVAELVVWTAIVARAIAFDTLTLPDVIIGAVVLTDAWLSPVNSFSMALRNISANVGRDLNHEAQ